MVATWSAGGPVTEITVLGTEQREAWGRQEMPPVEQLPAGMWSVPVPIPNNPLRYTLCYLIPGDDGLVVVDPGWATDEGWTALQAGLTAAGAGLDDVLGIVATHVHPDHHGASARLQEATGAWIAMHPDEAESLPQRQEQAGLAEGKDVQSLRRGGMEWMLRHAGAGEEEIAKVFRRFDAATGDGRAIHVMAEPDVLLADGDYVPLKGRRLRAVWTPGHTPGHICLEEPDARVMLTGDHVLPRISPNIGVQPNAKQPPLEAYLESLIKIGGYDDHDVFPAHEYRFHGLDTRARQISAHHEERCLEMRQKVSDLGTPTLWELASQLTWSRTWEQIGHMQVAALSETAAHVQYLIDRGELVWVDEPNVDPFGRSGVRTTVTPAHLRLP